MATHHPRFLLLGFDPRTCLAAARGFSRAGVECVIGQLCSWQQPLYTRLIRGWAKVWAEGPKGCIERSLREAIAVHGITHVVPMTDAAVIAVSRLPSEIWSAVALLGPHAEAAKPILDRAAFHALAERCGVPSPLTWRQGEPSRFPVFAKPMERSVALEMLRPGEPSLHCLPDLESYRKFEAGALNTRCPHWFEEFVPGVDVGLAVLRHEGKVVASFQYAAGRTFPARGGVAVVCRSEMVDPRLLGYAERILEVLDWKGVAQFDFRREPAGGRTVLLEMNGRFWGSLGAAVYCGQDFPGHLANIALGRAVVDRGYRVGVDVRWFEGDLRRVLSEKGSGRRAALAQMVRDTFRLMPSMEGSGGDHVAATHGLCRLVAYWGFGRLAAVRGVFS